MKIIKIRIFSLILLLLSGHRIYTQNVPEGYLLQYQQNFSAGKALSDFTVENPDRWGIFKGNNNFYLQCSPADSQMLFPSNVAVLSNHIFGDFILEVDIMPG